MHTDQKGKNKIDSTCTISYIDYAKESTRKLELILEISNCPGYTMNIQNSVLFIHASTEHVDTKIKDTMPFTIAKRTLRYNRYKTVS